MILSHQNFFYLFIIQNVSSPMAKIVSTHVMFTVATRHVTDIMEVVKLIVKMEKVAYTVRYA